MDNIPSISEKHFSIKMVKENDKYIVSIIGAIDIVDPERVITPFFDNVDSFMSSNKLNEIFIDVCKLDFINSSGIKVFLKFVMSILQKSKKDQYSIKISYDSNLESQKTRFNSIYFLAPEIIEFIPV